MRERYARRMLVMTGWLLGLLAVSGCRSTSSASSVARDSGGSGGVAAQDLARLPPPTDWAKVNAPSTAMAQEQWTKPAAQEHTVRTTAFQDKPAPKAEWMPPIPEVMIKDKKESAPLFVHTSVGPGKHVRHHGKAPMPLPNAPNEQNRVALPAYVIRPADVLTIELLPQFTRDPKDQLIKKESIGLNQPIYGPHPVHQDGTISLGIYGTALVAGKTVSQAREEIADAIFRRLDPKGPVQYKDVLYNLKVDIANYNNGFYYVIVNYAGTAGVGEFVERFPITGTDTVLDGVSKIKGLPGAVSPTRIWVARPSPEHTGPDNILPVDWKAITQQGSMASNWQLMPGDRVYLNAYPIRRFDNGLGRVLSPMYKMLNLGQGINALRNGNNTNLIVPPGP